MPALIMNQRNYAVIDTGYIGPASSGKCMLNYFRKQVAVSFNRRICAFTTKSGERFDCCLYVHGHGFSLKDSLH